MACDLDQGHERLRRDAEYRSHIRRQQAQRAVRRGADLGAATPEEFAAARDRSARAAFLSPETTENLAGKELHLSGDGKVGYALDKEGDLQNLFNNGGPKGAGRAALADAVKNGAKTLDAFDPKLPEIYSEYGFVPTGRMAFNDEYAPKNWNFVRDGRPDVVFMAYQGGSRDTISDRAGTFPAYRQGSAPLYTDFDQAKAVSRAAARD